MTYVSEHEKYRRRSAMESVRGSLAMSGLILDTISNEIVHRYAEGELSLEQFSSQMQAHAENLAAVAIKQQSDAS